MRAIRLLDLYQIASSNDPTSRSAFLPFFLCPNFTFPLFTPSLDHLSFPVKVKHFPVFFDRIVRKRKSINQLTLELSMSRPFAKRALATFNLRTTPSNPAV